MEKRLFQLAALIFGAIFLWTIWSPLWRMQLNEAVNPKSEEKIVFNIEKGSSGTSIANDLKKEDLITSKKAFLRTIEKEELTQSLRFGSFVIQPNFTLREVITTLTTEGTGEQAITILEGWTIDDIDAKLTEMELIEAGEFRLCTLNCEFDYDFLDNDRSLEGFLFPDTYFIEPVTFTSEGLINTLLTTFDSRFTDEMRADAEAAGRTIRETIIVASMIEKEVRTADDIPVVGGIIWKRLDADWMLGIDATLLYVQDDNVLTAADLAEESPYNTRINTGLPPTAISNPGLASLQGAVYPELSPYWFYLTTLDTGEVIYAETNEGHVENKVKYL